MTGVSLRVIQYLDERGIVVPKRVKGSGGGGGSGRIRSYSAQQVNRIRQLQDLRRQHRMHSLKESVAILRMTDGPIMVITKPTFLHGILVVPKPPKTW